MENKMWIGQIALVGIRRKVSKKFETFSQNYSILIRRVRDRRLIWTIKIITVSITIIYIMTCAQLDDPDCAYSSKWFRSHLYNK